MGEAEEDFVPVGWLAGEKRKGKGKNEVLHLGWELKFGVFSRGASDREKMLCSAMKMRGVFGRPRFS